KPVCSRMSSFRQGSPGAGQESDAEAALLLDAPVWQESQARTASATESGGPRLRRAAAAVVLASAGAAAAAMLCAALLRGSGPSRGSSAAESLQERFGLRLSEDAVGSQLFNCLEDLETWEDAWPEPKRAFCCETRWIGCSDGDAPLRAAAAVDAVREFSSVRKPRSGAAAGADGAEEACRTALEGEPCYLEVRWAMRTGIHRHPTWYVGLSERSSFEDFQEFIYSARRDAPCRRPCARAATVAPVAAPKPGHGNRTASTSPHADEAAGSGELLHGELGVPTTAAPTKTVLTATTLQAAEESPADCHTAVDGEPCYSHVVWAMRVGIGKNPEWYDGLNGQSSMEEFQTHIHWNNPELDCDIPCASTVTASGNTSSTGEPLPVSTSAHALRSSTGRAPRRHGSSNDTRNTSSTGTATTVTTATSTITTTITTTEACETAAAGSECYQNVLWAAQVGTCQHPDWYPELTRKSSFEAFQKHLYLTDKAASGAACQMPCVGETAVPPKPGPTIFCFAVANEDYEMDIMRFQHDRCAGIFDCTETAIISQFPDAGGLPVMQIDWMDVGVSQDGFAANTEVFLQAWSSVRGDGRFANFDWTVKADPDCVLVPDRLRWRLGSFGVGNFYVANCDRGGQAPPMMYGAVEAISNEAVQA
ncbi:unnamed protein product, partial [Prorocentrum cordatum]